MIFSLFINVSKYTNKFYPPNGVLIHPFHPSILLQKIIHLIFFQLALLNPSLIPATAIFHLLLLPMFEATDKSSSANHAPSGSQGKFHLGGMYARIFRPENLRWFADTIFEDPAAAAKPLASLLLG